MVERFLSNAINNIDAKGRVSVPAHFRQVLAGRGVRELYALQAIGQPAIDVGGMDLLERYEARLGPEFKPAELLRRLANEGGSFTGAAR